MYSTLLIVLLGLGAVHCSNYGYYGLNGYRSGYGYNQGAEFCRRPNFHGLVVTPFKESYKDRETIEISCKEGYELKAKQTNSSCFVNDLFGRFGVFIPAITPSTCRELPMCRPPIGYGVIVTPMKSIYDLGENITLSCKEGYAQPGGESTHTCKDYRGYGRASFGVSGSRVCREIRDCHAPDQQGLVVEPLKTMYEPGAEISLSCEEGFELVVSSVSVCQQSGYFDFEKNDDQDYDDFQQYHYIFPTHACRKKAKCMPLSFPGLIVTPDKSSYISGDEVTLSCEEGYELTAPNKSMCDYEEYKGGIMFEFFGFTDTMAGIAHFEPRVRSRTCSPIPKCYAPQYQGTIITPEKSAYMLGETIEVSCTDGYELIGESNRTCVRHDMMDNFYRHSGYYYHGYSRAQFQPRINHVCQKIPKCYAPQDRGTIITPKKTAYMLGETIEISCMHGYELVGESNRTCARQEEMDSSYRHSGYYHGYSRAQFQPKMNYVCKKKKTCKAPMVRGVVMTPKKSAYEIGESVSVSCEPGYVLKQGNESTCQSRDGRRSYSGKFSPEIDGDVCEKIPSCDKPTSDGLIVTPEKDYYDIGDKVTLSCEEGYEQRAAPMSTCMRMRSSRKEGSFDPVLGREPCRKPTFCQAHGDDNLTVKPAKESYEEGDEITLSCQEGYTLVAPKHMKCERAYNCRGSFGRVAGCFHPSGPRVACVEKRSCSVPETQPGIVITPQKDDKYYEGDEIQISCSEGYELVGPDASRCVTKTRHFFFNVDRRTMFKPALTHSSCKELPEVDTSEPGEERSAEVGTSKPEGTESRDLDMPQSSTEIITSTEPTPSATASTTSETTESTEKMILEDTDVDRA